MHKIAIAIACAAFAAWLFRYDLHTTMGQTHKLDRWTGEVVWLNTDRAYPVQRKD